MTLCGVTSCKGQAWESISETYIPLSDRIGHLIIRLWQFMIKSLGFFSVVAAGGSCQVGQRFLMVRKPCENYWKHNGYIIFSHSSQYSFAYYDLQSWGKEACQKITPHWQAQATDSLVLFCHPEMTFMHFSFQTWLQKPIANDTKETESLEKCFGRPTPFKSHRSPLWIQRKVQEMWRGLQESTSLLVGFCYDQLEKDFQWIQCKRSPSCPYLCLATASVAKLPHE